MEEKDKDLNNIIFTPQIGFGKILFSFNKEEDILNVLDTPYEREIYIFNDNEYVIHLDYWDINISVSLYFEDRIFDYLSIHTQDAILDNFQFSRHNQSEILTYIKEYHSVYKLDFVEKKEYDKDVDETCFTYDNVGLTIWFDGNGISGICVQKTDFE